MAHYGAKAVVVAAARRPRLRPWHDVVRYLRLPGGTCRP